VIRGYSLDIRSIAWPTAPAAKSEHPDRNSQVGNRFRDIRLRNAEFRRTLCHAPGLHYGEQDAQLTQL